MDKTILSSLIVAGFALLGTVISSKFVANVRVVKLEMKLDELERTVNKHNNVIARTYELERKVSLLEKVVDHN